MSEVIGDRDPSFVRRWLLDKLMLVETRPTILGAIARGKCMEAWRRIWKTRLISGANPAWNDVMEMQIG